MLLVLIAVRSSLQRTCINAVAISREDQLVQIYSKGILSGAVLPRLELPGLVGGAGSIWRTLLIGEVHSRDATSFIPRVGMMKVYLAAR